MKKKEKDFSTIIWKIARCKMGTASGLLVSLFSSPVTPLTSPNVLTAVAMLAASFQTYAVASSVDR